MIPGEVRYFGNGNDVIRLNENRDPVELKGVLNTSDRPIQIGSHYHFAEANTDLEFDRDEAWGRRLDIAAGTSMRFEPNIPQTVTLVRIVGRRRVPGLHGLTKDQPNTGLPHRQKGPNGELDPAHARPPGENGPHGTPPVDNDGPHDTPPPDDDEPRNIPPVDENEPDSTPPADEEGRAKLRHELCDHVADLRGHQFLIMLLKALV